MLCHLVCSLLSCGGGDVIAFPMSTRLCNWLPGNTQVDFSGKSPFDTTSHCHSEAEHTGSKSR